MYQRVDENTVACFVQPEINNIQAAKNLFRSISDELQLQCCEKDVLFMVAQRRTPFSTFITLTLTPHPTKGYLGILHSKPINKLQSFGASLLPGWLSCNVEVSQCKKWYECSKHYLEGLEQYHRQFFRTYIQTAREKNILFQPQDSNPICLDASCILLNTTQSTCVGLNEKMMFYSDISSESIENGKFVVIKVISSKRIQLLIRYGDRPSTFIHDAFAISDKLSDSSFCTKFILLQNSEPQLKPGRWFFSVRGSSLISRSNLTVSLSSKFKFIDK